MLSLKCFSERCRGKEGWTTGRHHNWEGKQVFLQYKYKMWKQLLKPKAPAHKEKSSASSVEQQEMRLLSSLFPIVKKLIQSQKPSTGTSEPATNTGVGLLQLQEFDRKKRIIKDLFLQRDFEGIFKNKELLSVYGAEYLGGRVLLYLHIFSHQKAIASLLGKKEGSTGAGDDHNSTVQIACLGAGNGAELAALIPLLYNERDFMANPITTSSSSSSSSPSGLGRRNKPATTTTASNNLFNPSADATNSSKTGKEESLISSKKRKGKRKFNIIVNDWTNYHMVDEIWNLLRDEYHFDRQSSEMVIPEMENVSINIKDAKGEGRNERGINEDLMMRKEMESEATIVKVTNDYCNLIDLQTGDLSYLKDCDLITACFLLNEIITLSKKSFVLLVKKLVGSMKKGALLLVVDPASSFSEFSTSTSSTKDAPSTKDGSSSSSRSIPPQSSSDDKGISQPPTPAPTISTTYKLFTLLDAIQGLECLYKSDSDWYRFNPVHQKAWPLKLQNMRCCIRLYRKE